MHVHVSLKRGFGYVLLTKKKVDIITNSKEQLRAAGVTLWQAKMLCKTAASTFHMGGGTYPSFFLLVWLNVVTLNN